MLSGAYCVERQMKKLGKNVKKTNDIFVLEVVYEKLENR